ncbi:MAG: hypothetical protein HQ553_18685 [Chloroflexi bacterium]|nr:hypothetical protein [Chloroflexota bacterium]
MVEQYPWVEIDRYPAVTDDGKRYTVIVMRREGSTEKHLTTLEGYTIDRINTTTLKIFDTQEVIRKID